MREARLFRYGSLALQAAFREGTLSLYRASTIARLPANQQELALAQWSARSQLRTEGQALAAKAIRAHLGRYPRVDLGEIAAAIRAAIAARA